MERLGESGVQHHSFTIDKLHSSSLSSVLMMFSSSFGIDAVPEPRL
jgi:hypothetical protein